MGNRNIDAIVANYLTIMGSQLFANDRNSEEYKAMYETIALYVKQAPMVLNALKQQQQTEQAVEETNKLFR